MASTEEEKIKRVKKLSRDTKIRMNTHTKIHKPPKKGRNKKGQKDIDSGIEEWYGK